MEITREELNPCTIQLKVTVEKDHVRAGFEKAFKRLTKNIKVPGFRPGHVPKKMLEGMVPNESLYEAAADLIVRDAFKQALEQEKLSPHSQPSVEITALNHEEELCEFSAKIPLAPKVELSDYKGLSATQPPLEVTDEEVDYQIDELRRHKSERRQVSDRGIQEGDVAVVNVKVEGEEGDGRNFMTIAGKTFPQLDQALMGMKADEIKSLDLTFPETFQEKDWAGKPYKAQVSVRSISAVELPELDDEFAQSLDTQNVDELKSRMTEAIKAAKATMAQDYVNEQLLEAILQKSTIHVPDTMWEQVASRRLNDLAAEQAQKGKNMEDYAKENGMSIQELVDAWQAEAKLHVQRAVVVQEIFEREKLQLTNNDLNNELVSMAREYNTDPKELLTALQKQNALQELQFRAVFRKVTDFIRENATITESAPETQEKAPAKKKSKK
jgi:trigger factor